MEPHPDRSRQVTLLLAGDVMTGRGIDQILTCSCPPRLHERVVTSALDYVALAERANGPIPRPAEPTYPWGDALELLEHRSPDLRIINLETSVTTADRPFAEKEIHYRMHPGNLDVLRAARIDCCALANNHVLDWGETGLLETLDSLAAEGIGIAGAGPDLESAMAPATFQISEDRRVLVFSMGARDSGIPMEWAATPARPGIHLLPDLSDRTAGIVAELVGRYRGDADVVVASIHWGTNWGFGIPPRHRSFAHSLVSEGSVDVVHGHSSHHPRAIEVYRGRPIFYGAGDLLNDYEGIDPSRRIGGDLVAMYLVTFDAASRVLLHLEIVPLRIRRFALRRVDDADRYWLREIFDRECARFGHSVRPSEDGFRLEW
jgi:poly-gamma-glutamate capsule biosynthesis protein CapA/YwtB (metallophosphatase superfamily)